VNVGWECDDGSTRRPTYSRHGLPRAGLEVVGNYRYFLALGAKIVLALLLGVVSAASSYPQSGMTFEAPAANRFVAAHGRRAWAGGYADGGLEVWAGALQIADEVKPEFLREGDVNAVSGSQILARVEVDPAHFTRTYAGPDFTVDEEIRIPLDQPAILIRYSVSGHPLRVIVRFRPSLNLMWPGALGGLDIRWDDPHSAYILSEPSHKFSSAVLAPRATAHDEPLKDAHLLQQSQELSIELNAQSPQILFAQLGTALDNSLIAPNAGDLQEQLTSSEWQRKSQEHYEKLLASGLQIETPDKDLNRAFAWAKVDLDQDWLCNDQLGCGFVGGFGASRRDRRPQYAWFFAGDGMVALHAATAIGNLERARDEIRFIAMYQDTKTGMIWHELSQSAPYLDWRNKYPFMFVHADLTYPYVSAIADYIRRSNDREFLREIWPSAQKAFAYGRSLIADDGLPRIPEGKEGADEQDRLTDELGLSAAWIEACNDYSFLANLAGDAKAAQEIPGLSEKARASFGNRYWDSQKNFAIQGYRSDGTPVADRGLGAIKALQAQLFSGVQRQHVLDEIASSRFQSDWGTRGVAIGEAGYDPTGYAHGSVSALHTAEVAQVYWTAHQPETAFQVFRALVPWFSLDSPGHIHEVLQGDVYYPQSESVPEQMWSAAGFISAAVYGLFGLNINAVRGVVELEPHLPVEWDEATLRGVRMGDAELSFLFQQSTESLAVHIENTGQSLPLLYSPAIPIGAQEISATANGKKIKFQVATHPEDTNVTLRLRVPHGPSDIVIRYRDGVGVIIPKVDPVIGQRSKAMKLTFLALDADVLHVGVDVPPAERTSFDLRTGRTIQKVTNAAVKQLSNEFYEVTLLPGNSANGDAYRHEEVGVTFKRESK
jgi:hypothetical protein